MVTMLIVVGAVGVAGVIATMTTAQDLSRRVEPMRLNNAHIDTALTQASRGVRGFILTREPRLLEQYSAARQRIPELMAQQRSLARGAELTLLDYQQQALQRWIDWQGSAENIQQRYPSDRGIDRQRFAESAALFEQAQASITRLDEVLSAQQQALQQRVSLVRTASLVTMGVLAVASLVLAVRLVRRLSRSVSQPLASTVDALDRLAQGDVTVRVTADDEDVQLNEVQVVARSVNALARTVGLEQQRQAQRAWARQQAREIGQVVQAPLERSDITARVVNATASTLQARSVGLFLQEQGQLVRHRLWCEGVLIPTVLPDVAASTPSAGSVFGVKSEDSREQYCLRGVEGEEEQLEPTAAWLHDFYACGQPWMGSSQAKDLLDEDQGRLAAILDKPAVGHGLAELSVGQVVAISRELATVMSQGWADVPVAGYQPPHRRQADTGVYDQWCAVAIGEGSQVRGLLIVELPAPRLWSEALTEFMQMVAADAGQALHHARLYEERGQVISQLEQLDLAKSEFLATTSHELRTPLTSIYGCSEALVDYPIREDAQPGQGLTAQQHTMVEVVHRNATRLRSLIDDLLTLSRMDSGALKPPLVPVVVADWVRRVAGLVPPLLEARQQNLRVDLGPAGVSVLGDMATLERALLNALSNAIKFSPEGGLVQLLVRVHPSDEGGDQVSVSVIDQGIGIPLAEQAQLFTRFFRASNATSAAVPGTGLGLNIAASIMEHHGGSVHLESVEGHGTTVIFRLPVAVSPTPPTLPTQSTGTHDHPTPTHLGDRSARLPGDSS